MATNTEEQQIATLNKNIKYFAKKCMDNVFNEKTGYCETNTYGFKKLYYFCKDYHIEPTIFSKWIETKPHPYLNFSKEKLEKSLKYYSTYYKDNYVPFKYFDANKYDICCWLLKVFQYELAFIETLFVQECNNEIPNVDFLQKLYRLYPNISQEIFEQALSQLCENYEYSYGIWNYNRDLMIKKQFLISKWLLETKPEIATSQCVNKAFTNACKNDHLILANLLFIKNLNIEVEITNEEEHNERCKNILSGKFCELLFKANPHYLQKLEPMTNNEITETTEYYNETCNKNEWFY